jgi:hypothetical protein
LTHQLLRYADAILLLLCFDQSLLLLLQVCQCRQQVQLQPLHQLLLQMALCYTHLQPPLLLLQQPQCQTTPLQVPVLQLHP